MNSILEIIKQVDGYAILSLPADIDDATVPELSSQLCEFIVHNNVPGLIFDFSNLHSMDRALCHSLTRLMYTAHILGVTVNTTGICAGIASTLALLDSNTEHIRAFGTLDRCLADLKNHNSNQNAAA